ncbi:hypothetical protein JTB14_031081 [Gonioctena quinquepunctata]|nr:hypothetical protein JTB14_031081 [Gonioctena quinquepunctata]
MASKRPKKPSKLTDEELQQYHEEYLDLDDGLPLFEDSSDEEDHYDVADLSLLPACTIRDGTTWYKRPIHSTKSTGEHFIRQGLGLSEYSKNFETMVEVFSLLLTNNFLEIIVEKTNEKAIVEYEEWNEKHLENTKVWTPTDSLK